MSPIAGLTFGKKILLKTMAAASEYSWKSMNSIAVPSQPDTAALVRSRVVLVTTPVGAAWVLSVIVCSIAQVRGVVGGRSEFDASGAAAGAARRRTARRSPVVHGAVEAPGDGQVAGVVGEALGGLLVVLDTQPGHVRGVEHPVLQVHL